MGYLPQFEEDVFISYASNDNDIYLDEKDGWVTELHRNLEKRVRNYLGSDVRLWRDADEISSHDDFSIKIANRLARTATLLPVLSPSFLKREWTIRELKIFVENADRESGLLIDGEKSRIFKVEKMPVDRDELPPVMQGTRSYQFYRPDPAQPKRQREFRPCLGGEYKQRYFEQMDELAKDIASLLEEMAKAGKPKADSIAVYVAETTSDLDDQLREIRREIKALGHTVLPAGDLPRRAKDYVAQVANDLQRAAISVHLVGSEYGIVPEGEAMKSTVWLQHDLAMTQSIARKLPRVIWMPPGLAPVDQRQLKFLEFLRSDEGAQDNAEVLETSFEDVKTTVADQLNAIQRARAAVGRENVPVSDGDTRGKPRAEADDEPLSVYVICDQLDLKSPSLTALRKCLLAAHVEPVFLTQDEGDSAALSTHLENLELCDAFLIYYGHGSQQWFDGKLRDFRKYLRGRARPVLARAVYVAPPETDEKLSLETNLATVIHGGPSFSPGELEPFIQRLSTP